QLEMGGKNAILVLKDANLQKAADSIITDAYSAAGQKCTAASRIMVEAEVYDQVKKMLIKRTEEIVVGNPHNDNTFLGPVATKKQYNSV
ncbi:aldehyde dehydrogenase family protein, partial [Campylobacter upsaliensis]|nr:aldehyde dehydrogenase family protein [Campylobacter upsaliensis]